MTPALGKNPGGFNRVNLCATHQGMTAEQALETGKKLGLNADNSAIKLQGYSSYETMAQLKQAFFADLDGQVLEIGPGAGANFS